MRGSERAGSAQLAVHVPVLGEHVVGGQEVGGGQPAGHGLDRPPPRVSVRFGRLELACETDGLAVGTPVTIAVRPEDILVQGVTADDENAYEARVRRLEFLGSFVRADLASEVTGEDPLRADLSINLIRRQSIADGDSLLVRIPRERIRIYPGSVSRE